MSRKNVSRIVRAARNKLGLTQSEAAKKLKLSPAYFGLIDRGYPTHVSDRVASSMIKRLGCPKSLLGSLESHNELARKDQAKWRKRMAKKAA